MVYSHAGRIPSILGRGLMSVTLPGSRPRFILALNSPEDFFLMTIPMSCSDLGIMGK